MTDVSSEAAAAEVDTDFLPRAAVAGLPTLLTAEEDSLATLRRTAPPPIAVAGRAPAELPSGSPTKSMKAAPLALILGALKTLNFFFYASMSVI